MDSEKTISEKGREVMEIRDFAALTDEGIEIGDEVVYRHEFFDVAGHRVKDEFVAGIVESFDGNPFDGSSTVNVRRPEGHIAQYRYCDLHIR